MAEIRCPMCSKPNSEELETCQFCGARLKPLVAPSPDSSPPIRAGETPVVKATSEFEKVKLPDEGPIRPGEEPTPKKTEDLEHALPSWLRSLRDGEEQPPSEPPADAFPARQLPAEPPASPPAEPEGESLDWLAGLGSASKEEEEVPDWLAGLRAPARATPEPFQLEADRSGLAEEATEQGAAGAQPESEDALPDWFSRIEQEPAGTLPSESAPEAAQELELPDWLETLKAKTTGTGELFTSEEEFPDWLSGMPIAPPEAPSSDAQIEPDWLNKLRDKAAEPEAEHEPPPAAPVSDTPDWLAGIGAQSGAQPVFETSSVFKEETPAEALAPAELPDWLSSLQSDINAAARREEPRAETGPEPPAPEKTAEPLPDWLSGIEQTGAAAGAVPPLAANGEAESAAPETSAAFTVETPDWLSRLRPERGPETQAPLPETEPEDLEAAELPSWVQAMRPVEAVVSDDKSSHSEEGGVTESSGPLAGLRGVLPAGAGIGISRRPPAYSIKLHATENQLKYAGQLEKMLTEEGQAKGPEPVRLASNRLWRWVISVILLLAVLLPLALGSQSTPDLNFFPSEWSNTKALLDALPDSAPVLAVFDYDPALSGELQAAAAPVIDRMLYLGARLTLISTSPTGPALAEQFLKSTQSYHIETGMQYVNLGYLPGGPAGIYYFASGPQAAAPLTVNGAPAWETDALQGVGQFSDFAMLVILTDTADTGRAWIEQTRSFVGETPILVVISAQAEPMIRPYYDARQIQGLVTGLVGGKTYEQSFGTGGLARQYWDAFGTGTLAALLLIIVGGVFGAALAWRDREKEKEA